MRPDPVSIIVSTLLAGVLLLAPVSARSACGPLTGAYAAAGGEGGLALGNNIRVNGNRVRDTPTGTNDVMNPDASLDVEALTLPDLDPASFPANTSSVDVRIDERRPPGQLTSTVATFYDDIEIGQNGHLILAGGGPFHIARLQLDQNANITLQPGVYFIDEVSLGQNADVLVPAPSVILHIGTRLVSDQNATINEGGAVTDVRIMLHTDAEMDIGKNGDVTAVVLGPQAGRIELDKNVDFHGTILSRGEVRIDDNVRITLTPADQVEIGAISSCSVALAGFAIDFAAAASTCVGQSISIAALDASGAVLSDYAGTVTLSTSSNHGDWSRINAVNGVVPVGTADDGRDAYEFDPADGGTIELALTNLHAETLTIDVTDSGTGISTTSGPLAFADNALIATSAETFADPVAGRDHRFQIGFYTRDNSSVPLPALPDLPCRVVDTYSGNKPLLAWYEAGMTHPAGADPPQLVGATPPQLPVVAPGAVNLNLEFVAGIAEFDLRTTDVGRFSLRFRDPGSGFADAPVEGYSALMTVRPFGLRILTVEPPGAPPSTPIGNNVFKSAGEQFAINVAAVRWQNGDLLDGAGNPVDSDQALDNTLLTRSFAATTSLTPQLVSPAPGSVGVLARTVGTLPLSGADFTAGNAALADIHYSEVGSMRIVATSSGFLGSSHDIGGRSPVIGRFKPHHFNLALLNAPLWRAGCTEFTYLGQALDFEPGFAPRIALTAHNAQHATTLNYHHFTPPAGPDWWSVSDTDLVVGINDAGAGAGITLAYTGAGAAHQSIATSTSAGRVEFELRGPFAHARPAPATYAAGQGYAPFDATPAFTLSFANADGDDEGDLDIFPNETIPRNQVRHGRLRIDSANGSELLDLRLPLHLETFVNGAWTTATDDTCSVPMQINDFIYLPASRSADASSAFIDGAAGLEYRCSVLACSVDPTDNPVDINADLGDALGVGSVARAWLRYDWDGDGIEQDPAARASFGVYQGSNKQIYLREQY